jgi:pilus assembly protein CpaC
MNRPISTESKNRRAIGSCLVALLAVASVAAAAEMRNEELRLSVGRSAVIDYPADVARISTSNPDVVDAVAVSKREILLNAKAFGLSSVVVWSRAGDRTFFAVTVEQNLEPIRRLLKETFPGEAIDVRATKDSVAITGKVGSAATAERALALVTPMAKSVVNNLQVLPAGADKQIVLRVKFAELNRNAGTQLGVNLISTGALNTPGRISTGQFQSGSSSRLTGTIPGNAAGTTSEFSITDALNIFAFRPDLNLAAFVRALQNEGLLQILAEPNLVTTDGKQASFLVGGEFPVPVLQGGSNAGAVTIQFREFGIRLSFLPVSTTYNTIKMYVKPEVSTIDMANAVLFAGFTIPALASRRMETNVELGLGQSFVIAGLLDDRLTNNMMKIPGLAHIPLLGVLFKSRAENKSKTELIVMVTPEVTYPIEQGQPRPDVKMPKEFLGPVSKSGPKDKTPPRASVASVRN